MEHKEGQSKDWPCSLCLKKPTNSRKFFAYSTSVNAVLSHSPIFMLHPDNDMDKDVRVDEAVNPNELKNSQRSNMTRQKAGQRGGLTTAKRHGKEFYEKIGRKGGQSRKKRNRDGAAV